MFSYIVIGPMPGRCFILWTWGIQNRKTTVSQKAEGAGIDTSYLHLVFIHPPPLFYYIVEKRSVRADSALLPFLLVDLEDVTLRPLFSFFQLFPQASQINACNQTKTWIEFGLN